jgi:hypothetical protein
LVSDTFRDANSGSAPLAHISASYRSQEDNHFGIRLSTKPLFLDLVGHPVTRHPDSLDVVHLAVRDGLAPIDGAALSEWAIILYLHRVK